MKLVFSSFVFGSYQKYIPYYIYSIWKTHPSSFIKVFIEESLDFNISEALNCLEENGIRNFEIIITNFSYDDFQKYNIRGGGKKLVRWLIGPEYFKGFKYVYIGDVDILFLPEKLKISEFHKKQLTKFGLPFSNKVRVDRTGNTVRRLTGLHFIKASDYYEKIGPIISRIKKDNVFRDNYLKGLERDEQFLYKINKEAFNFDSDILSKSERPWHGMHLGITRGNKNLEFQTIEENSSLSLDEIRSHLRDYSKDPIFQEIQAKVFLIELEVILKKLCIPYPFLWKYKGFRYRFYIYMRTYKQKIKAYIR